MAFKAAKSQVAISSMVTLVTSGFVIKISKVVMTPSEIKTAKLRNKPDQTLNR
jgi:hypothetical protein